MATGVIVISGIDPVVADGPEAAFLCVVAVLRAKHDAGRSMLFVQL